MSWYYRLLRRLGKDTTTTVKHTHPIKDYRVTHLNGEVSEVRCHGYNVDGAIARFYTYTKAGTFHGFSRLSVYATGQTVVRTLGSIQEIEAITLGDSTFRATIDRADKSVLDTEVENLP